MSAESCEHKFVHLRNESFKRTTGRYSWEFKSTDYYFCEKCLQEKEIVKHHSCGDYQLDKIPDWASLITNKIASYD
jgi:hypothetical protein